MPKAATRDEVKAILAALHARESLKLEELKLERAAVAVIAMLGLRPGEARGVRWSDWDRTKQQIAVRRARWHRIETTPKTTQSIGFVPVTEDLRKILVTLWEEQKSPIDGYILSGPGGGPVILDNLAKRSIRDT